MSIHNVPHRIPRIADRLDGDPEARACTIFYIRRELGRQDYGDRRLVSYVQQLIVDHGFPPPLPAARKGRAGLSTDVCMESRWIRAAVDAWIADWLPPDSGAALIRADKTAAAEEMDAAALHLQVVTGGRA